MDIKNANQKLVLNKITIDNLNGNEMTIAEIFTVFQIAAPDGPATCVNEFA